MGRTKTTDRSRSLLWPIAGSIASDRSRPATLAHQWPDIKGIEEPVRAWAALRQASVEGRFEAFHASGLTDLIGRKKNSTCC